MVKNLISGHTYYLHIPEQTNPRNSGSLTFSMNCISITNIHNYISGPATGGTTMIVFAYNSSTWNIVIYAGSGNTKYEFYNSSIIRGDCTFIPSSSYTISNDFIANFITEQKPIRIKDDTNYLYPKTSANLVEGLDEAIKNAVPTETKTVTPSDSIQTITPSVGKLLEKVTVNAQRPKFNGKWVFQTTYLDILNSSYQDLMLINLKNGSLNIIYKNNSYRLLLSNLSLNDTYMLSEYGRESPYITFNFQTLDNQIFIDDDADQVFFIKKTSSNEIEIKETYSI